MLLVMDVGNSHTVLGLYKDEDLVARWRVLTANYRTTDEVRVLLGMLFQQAELDPQTVNGCCISSVVPPINYALEKATRQSFGVDPLIVGPGIKTGLVIKVENPKEVGADRIVDAVGALEEYEPPLIVVDFGTATTFDCITAKREYIGGAILPGIQISADVLCEKCAKLPRIEIARTPSVIGKDTVSHIRSGLTFGYADMVDGLLARMKKEMGHDPIVVATGGFGSLISDITGLIDHVDPLLTMKGLKAVYAKNNNARSEQ